MWTNAAVLGVHLLWLAVGIFGEKGVRTDGGFSGEREREEERERERGSEFRRGGGVKVTGACMHSVNERRRQRENTSSWDSLPLVV